MGLEWLWHLRLHLMFRLLKMLRVAADKIQLTAKSAAFSYLGELLQNCTFEFLEAVKFLELDSQLGFLSRQCG